MHLALLGGYITSTIDEERTSKHLGYTAMANACVSFIQAIFVIVATLDGKDLWYTIVSLFSNRPSSVRPDKWFVAVQSFVISANLIFAHYWGMKTVDWLIECDGEM